MENKIVFKEHFLVHYLENRSTFLHQIQTENHKSITNLVQSAIVFFSNSENWEIAEKNLGIFVLFCTDIPEQYRKEFAENLIQMQSQHASLFSLKLLNALR